MYMNSAKSLLLLYFLLSLFLGGCGQFGGLQGQAPVVNISDPSVYTSLHLHAAKKHIEQHIKGTNKDANEPNDTFEKLRKLTISIICVWTTCWMIPSVYQMPCMYMKALCDLRCNIRHSAYKVLENL